MLYSLNGTLVYKDEASLAVDCGGVAYLCRTTLGTLNSLPSLGEKVLVYTYLSVRGEALDLFAFGNKQELECFKMVTTVSGVGPKVALGLLSSLSPERFALCVASGDYKPLTVAPGVGKKLAERMVLELRDKVGTTDFSTPEVEQLTRTSQSGGNLSEAISALVVLGYSQTDATMALTDVDETQPVEEIIKLALKKLARGR